MAAIAHVITAHWKAESSQRWSVPLGAGVGKVFQFCPLPASMQLAACCNVAESDGRADW